MLDFWARHRLEVVILLDRAQGTAQASFGERFVDALVALTVRQLRRAHPGVRLGAESRFVVRRIFENTRSTLASILEHHPDEREMRAAVVAFWSYQIAGLRGFAAHVSSTRSAAK